MVSMTAMLEGWAAWELAHRDGDSSRGGLAKLVLVSEGKVL